MKKKRENPPALLLIYYLCFHFSLQVCLPQEMWREGKPIYFSLFVDSPCVSEVWTVEVVSWWWLLNQMPSWQEKKATFCCYFVIKVKQV